MTGNYLTQNGGKSYKQINFKGDVQHMAYDPRDSKCNLQQVLLYKSSDAGQSWEVLFPEKGMSDQNNTLETMQNIMSSLQINLLMSIE